MSIGTITPIGALCTLTDGGNKMIGNIALAQGIGGDDSGFDWGPIIETGTDLAEDYIRSEYIPSSGEFDPRAAVPGPGTGSPATGTGSGTPTTETGKGKVNLPLIGEVSTMTAGLIGLGVLYLFMKK